MNKVQRNKVIEEYYQEKQQKKRTEREERKAQAAREKRLLNSLDTEAYFRERVLYGKLFGGKFRYDGDYYYFKPVYFSIAYGEIKPVEIKLTNGKSYSCYIEYADGQFFFDVSVRQLDRDRARRFPVSTKTRSGSHFSSFSTTNRSPLDGTDLHLNLTLKTELPDNLSLKKTR